MSAAQPLEELHLIRRPVKLWKSLDHTPEGIKFDQNLLVKLWPVKSWKNLEYTPEGVEFDQHLLLKPVKNQRYLKQAFNFEY